MEPSPTQAVPTGVGPTQQQVRARRAWRRGLWWTGAASLGVSYHLPAHSSTFGPVAFMIGPVVSNVPRVSILLAVIGTACWAACCWLWATRPHTGHGSRARRITAKIASGAAGLVAVPALALSLAFALLFTPAALQRFYVLSPAGPGGCRVVIWQAPLWLPMTKATGWDTYTYVKVPGSPILRRVNGATTIPLQLSDPTARRHLTWRGDTAHVAVWHADEPGLTCNPLRTPATCPAP